MAQQSTAASLDALELHLLLATSGQENLLLQLDDLDPLDRLYQHIQCFFSSSNIQRTLQIIPAEVAKTADDADDVLEHFFISVEGEVDAIREVPQVLVIPYLEDYRRYIQTALKAVLRDRRFEHKGQTFNLPSDFLLVGITADRERIAPYIVDTFGLFLEVDDIPRSKNSTTIPPLIPLSPEAYYSPKLRTYAADVLSALRHHPFIHNTLLTARCGIQHLFKIATLWIRLKSLDDTLLSAGGDSHQIYQKEIEIRPADIVDILSACVLHRLRARLPEQRWDSFWNKNPPNEETQKMEEALTSGAARLRYDLIIEEILDKV